MQYILVGRPILGFKRILKQFTHDHYVEIPTVGWSTRMHCIYQNLDNIYYKYLMMKDQSRSVITEVSW